METDTHNYYIYIYIYTVDPTSTWYPMRMNLPTSNRLKPSFRGRFEVPKFLVRTHEGPPFRYYLRPNLKYMVSFDCASAVR